MPSCFELPLNAIYFNTRFMVYNFNAGPTHLPDAVINEASAAILDWNKTGLSILEIGHRSQAFVDVVEESRQLVSELLMLDSDDTAGDNLGSTHNNWPDKEDNHGASGTCMNFTDGHAQWVRKKEYLRVLNLSQDSNNRPPDGL
jgi:hypothetical protein